jgi:hypothetical protein
VKPNGGGQLGAVKVVVKSALSTTVSRRHGLDPLSDVVAAASSNLNFGTSRTAMRSVLLTLGLTAVIPHRGHPFASSPLEQSIGWVYGIGSFWWERDEREQRRSGIMSSDEADHYLRMECNTEGPGGPGGSGDRRSSRWRVARTGRRRWHSAVGRSVRVGELEGSRYARCRPRSMTRRAEGQHVLEWGHTAPCLLALGMVSSMK